MLMRRCTGACQGGRGQRSLSHGYHREKLYRTEGKGAAKAFGIHSQVFTVALLFFVLPEYHHFKLFFKR